MRRFSHFLYDLTVVVLCALIGLNIARNPAGFRNLMMRTASQIGTATSTALSGLSGFLSGRTPAGTLASGASSAVSDSGRSGQPAPVRSGDTPTPSAPVEGTASSSTGYWGTTGVDGLKVYEYGKSLLPAGAQQACYDQIAAGVLDVSAEITVRTNLDPATVEKIVDYYLADHAEVFYANSAGVSYRYSTKGSQVVYQSYTIKPKYLYDKETILRMRAAMGTAAQPFLQAAAGQSTAYKKELALHDTVVERLSYDMQAAQAPAEYPASFTAYGAFVNHTAVCEGYAKAMKLLLDSAGIESLYVTGTAANGSESGPHAWNVVQLGGKWYYLDATFDDPVTVTAKGQYVSSSRPDYTYFNFRSRSDHVLGRFDTADPFSADSENYETMPAI